MEHRGAQSWLRQQWREFKKGPPGERFTSLVGESPIQYLMRWRLALAAQMLREGREPIIRIAERSGYDSEAAFGRAFKREFGVPPATWRRAGASKP